jgi:hypothetical protein
MNRFIGLASIAAVLAGCYTLQPVRGAAPDVGQPLALDVNDAGRVALGGSMGPEISQIEGQLLSKDDSEYLVAVSGIKLLRGGEQAWSGEKVRIKSEYVSSVYRRRLSVGRTVALGAVGAGAIAFLVTRSLKTDPESPGETPTPGDTANTIRIPAPQRP